MQSLPLHTSCLFSMPLNDDIVDIEKPDGICSQNFIELFSSVLSSSRNEHFVSTSKKNCEK